MHSLFFALLYQVVFEKVFVRQMQNTKLNCSRPDSNNTMTTRNRRRNTEERRAAPTLLVDYSKQRANTNVASTAIFSSKSLHCVRTPLPSLVVPNPPSGPRSAAPDHKPVPTLSKHSRIAIPSELRGDDLPCSSVYQRKPSVKPSSQVIQTCGSRKWEIDEALLDASVKTFDNDSDWESESEGEDESDSVSGAGSGATSCEDAKAKGRSSSRGALLDTSRDTIGSSESSDRNSSSESSDSCSDSSDSDSSSSDDVPDDISELSDDESLRTFECFDTDKDAKDIKGESSLLMSVTSHTMTASLTESNPEFTSPVSFSLRRRKPTNNVSPFAKDVVPSAIRLQRSIARLLDDGSNSTSESQDANLAPKVNMDSTSHNRSALPCSPGHLPVGSQLSVSMKSVLRRSSSCNGSSFIQAASKKLAPARVPSKRNLLTPLINAVALPRVDATPSEHSNEERKVKRRSFARSSSESNIITLKPDGTVQRKGMGRTLSGTLGTLMNDNSARILIEKSLKASDAHARSTSVRSLVMSNSQRSLSGLGNGCRVMGNNSGRDLMNDNSGRILMGSGSLRGGRVMGNNSGRDVMDDNSGRILMGSSSGWRLANSNSGRSLRSNRDTVTNERRAKRRAQKSSTCDANEAQSSLTGNRSFSSLPSLMKKNASDTSAVLNARQGVVADRSSSSLVALMSLGALMKLEEVSDRSIIAKIDDRTHQGMGKSGSSSSLGRLMGMGDDSERSIVSRRRVGRRSSMDSVGSSESVASTINSSTVRNRGRRVSLNGSLTSLRDALAKDNPMPAGGSASSLFVTGSRIRKHHRSLD
jgi:hypothetical protein